MATRLAIDFTGMGVSFWANAVFSMKICHSVMVTSQVWFDGDEILWDRPGYMLTELLNSDRAAAHAAALREAALFSDVLPTFVALSHVGTANLVQLIDMPKGLETLLPPFKSIVTDIAEISGDNVVLVGNTMEHFREAQAKGWLTVWVNRDRSANTTDILPDAEIHSLLDLPDVVESMEEARAYADAVREIEESAVVCEPPVANS